MTEYLYNGWHKISEIKANIKGKEVTRELLHLKSAVSAIITDEEGKVGLVQQYRPTIEQTTLEIPAGVLDKEGYSPKETLIEELEEECGLTESDIISIHPTNPSGFYMVTGSSKAYMHLYRVKVKTQPKEVLVDDADVERTIWIPFDEFERLVLNEAIVDKKTIMTYYILKGES